MGNLLFVIRVFAVQVATVEKLVHLLVVLALRMLHFAPADITLGLAQKLEVEGKNVTVGVNAYIKAT